MQTYGLLRRLDPSRSIQRLGSLSTITATAQMLEQKIPMEHLQRIMESNLSLLASRAQVNCLMSTPEMLKTINQTRPLQLSSNLIVIDEADLLLAEPPTLSSFSAASDLASGDFSPVLKFKSSGVSTMSFIFDLLARKSKKEASKFLFVTNHLNQQSKAAFERFLKAWFDEISFVSCEKDSPKQLAPEFIEMENNDHFSKVRYILELLSKPGENFKKFVIFCNSKEIVSLVSESISSRVTNRKVISSFVEGSTAEQRMQALDKFLDTKGSVLVTTNLGSRGINFNYPSPKETDCCIVGVHYETTQNIEDFQRRASRANKTVVLVAPNESEYFRKIREKARNPGFKFVHFEKF